MKRPKIILALVILFGLTNIKTQCRKDFPPTPEVKYQFAEKISVSPYRLNYHVGDTIMLEMNIPGKKLFDTKTNTTVYFDSASFNVSVGLNLIFNNPYIGDGPFASFIYTQGVSAYTQNNGGSTYTNINTGCSHTNDYTLKAGVILLQKGVFSLYMNTYFTQNCYTGFPNMDAPLGFTLDVDDSHKSFYEQLPFSDIGKSPDQNVISQLDSKAIAIINVE